MGHLGKLVIIGPENQKEFPHLPRLLSSLQPSRTHPPNRITKTETLICIAMEEGDHHLSGRKRAPETRDDAIDGASSDSAASRRKTIPAPFISAGMWYGRGIAERDRDKQLMMADRRRLEYVIVTDPDAGMPKGYMKHSPGARMLVAMGYKVGMGVGKDPGIRMPPEPPCPLRVWRRGIKEPTPSSATENLPYP
ncbi:hypothetical protein ACQ4PT_028225 [Festuca glaucescens]